MPTLKEVVWEECSYVSQDVENFREKGYLLPALNSNVKRLVKMVYPNVTKYQIAYHVKTWFNSL